MMSDEVVAKGKVERTASPWSVSTGNRGTLCILSDDTWIAGELSNGNGESPGEGDANAAFIVRACNAHDDLVEALYRLKTECEIEGLQSKAGFDTWISMASKALALAEPSP